MLLHPGGSGKEKRAKRRYAILVAAVGMQMCLDATYSWSIYVQPLRQAAGLMQGTAQLPFTLFYFAFPATMALAGGFFPRLAPGDVPSWAAGCSDAAGCWCSLY